MEFTLSYRGELKSNGDKEHKHILRRRFHSQLAELWRQPPLNDRPELAADSPGNGNPSLSVRRDPFRFVPLVSTRICAIAGLDILMLRPGAPGDIIRGGGDIDNRLKTLLDALKVPEANALPSNCTPQSGEDPFYCLLEDDKLVTSIRIETDRLLDASIENEVLLVVRVSTKLTEVYMDTIGL
jgi:hypothetical protein